METHPSREYDKNLFLGNNANHPLGKLRRALRASFSKCLEGSAGKAQELKSELEENITRLGARDGGSSPTLLLIG